MVGARVRTRRDNFCTGNPVVIRRFFYHPNPTLDKDFLHVVSSGINRAGRGRAMPATTTKRKRGRPRKPDSEKRRNNVTIRMRDAVKRRLEKAAAKAGRSLSEEIEFRLEWTIVERAYFGGDRSYESACLLFAAITMYEITSGRSWRSDPGGNLWVRAIADDFFQRWGPDGLKDLQPFPRELREVVKPGVSDDLAMLWAKLSFENTGKRASRSLKK